MPDITLISSIAESLSVMAGTSPLSFFNISAETLFSIFTTIASAGAILWKMAKKDQQFVSMLERVKEIEDGYLPRSEFKMYCDSQQEAIKSLVSNFNSRMDLLDKHIQDLYRQHPPNPERKSS